MKAVVVHQYGGPEVLKFEEYPDPVAGPGEVLVRVAATSVNPIDYKRRAGLTKDFYPINFPGLMGVDIAGTVVMVGPGVEGFSRGDQVFAMAADTYAELCVVKAAILAKVPKGLDLIQAAALPLVTTTGNQLISGTGMKAGRRILVVGAAGNVGRSAVFTAKQRGAVVIAGVLKSQMDEAKTIGADQSNRGHERKIGNEKGSARNQPRFEAEWRWVSGMPGVTERLVVSSPSVCGVWAHRML
jgi:NADPH:quinone reductase-like Zn-dependent oxidoreductase